MMTVEILQDFMDYGLIIWFRPAGNTYTVQKVKTHISPTDVLHNEVEPSCCTKEFPHIDAAYDFCRKFCESGIEEANLKECQVQIGYNPTGLAMKVKLLDNVTAASYEEAVEMANQQALDFFETIGIAKRIGDNFEVKVIPV